MDIELCKFSKNAKQKAMKTHLMNKLIMKDY